MKDQAKLKKFIYLLIALIIFQGTVFSVHAKNNFVVCIDPGHQAKGDPRGESIAPGSGQKKARVSSGTSGVGTKRAEYEVNLEAAMVLKGLLEAKGYTVVMTRESHDVSISNAERAEIANRAKADMTIRLHCDSIGNSGKTGTVLLVPSKSSKYTSGIYEASYKYAELLRKALNEASVRVNGIYERSDITGFNYSKVPVIIFEMGFMSNWTEDKMLSDKNYQIKLMNAAAEALDAYREALK